MAFSVVVEERAHTAPPPVAQEPSGAAEYRPEIEQQVRAAQAEMTFARSRGSNLLGAPVALLVAWVLWNDVPQPWLVAWVLAKCATTAWRQVIARQYDRDGPARVLHWGARLEAALLADGLAYGLLATLLLPRHDPVLAAAMVATVIGIGAIGLVVLSMSLRATLAFAVPVLLPGMLWRLAEGGPTATYMGIGMGLLLGLVAIEGRRASEHTKSMLRLRFTMDGLAREREQVLQLAERSNVARGDFIATISHEVRTPLHGILGLTRLLQADAAEEVRGGAAQTSPAARRRRTERLRTIEKSGEHLLAIINDVLDHSRIEGGQLSLVERPFDLLAVVGEAVELQRAAAQLKGLYLSWLADMPAPHWVLGDAARVRQILLNLLGNAVKFTERGGVDLRLVHAAQGLALIEVTDSGPGVPAAERERIFGAFEQLDGSFSRRHGGTGLGLTISRQLARAMHGDIECGVSTTGGALFRLRLMLPTCAAPAAAAPASASDEMGAALGGKILLVEDNAVNAIVAESSLQQLGLDVTTVGDGNAAIAACAERSYDLVLMDCQLPGLDGFEATRRIRAGEQRRAAAPMPIVALTANALAGDRARCLAAGMNDHLAKPFSAADLQTLLRRYLSAR